MNRDSVIRLIGTDNYNKAKYFKSTIVYGINEVKYFNSIINYNKIKGYKNVKKIIYLLTPQHGNMGDQAIAYATNKFLKDKFSDYEVLEFNRDEIYNYGKAIKMILNPDDLIVLHGGGNIGNLYLVEERPRRFIIKKFNGNKIVSMTQTISFTNDKEGKSELKRTKKIYNNHNSLTLIAREQTSYEIMQKEIDNAEIIINPDIVMYLYGMYDFNKDNRTNIMTCLRSDKESILGNKKDIFIEELNRNYNNTFNYDTVIDKTITKDIRENELKAMFDKFLKSKVVITDRLHGMVFCVITKTPCIVTKSLDHKVAGTYQWVKDLNYIKMVNDLNFNKIKPIIHELSCLEEVNEINLKDMYFNTLRERLSL